MDNFFTSVSLAQNLLSKRTTLVGTTNKERRDNPSYVKNLTLDLCHTKTFKTENDQCLLTVYQTKRHKNVLLLHYMKVFIYRVAMSRKNL
ncbi:unnamed protein product [Parnassius mnemosyne]|uniref:PiggyBac transposable element-derived protein domain-containing protein n=1 Tax=Parnassius mnemosyne TaxID=213953 RepID=A0AAV1KZY8_9NEOP